MRFSIYYPRAIVGDGGATSTMWEWARALSSAKHEVRVLADAESNTSRHNIEVTSVPHVGAGRLRLPRSLDHCLNQSVLLLHSGFVISNALAGRAARKQGIPYVVMPQGAYLARNRHRKPLLKKFWALFEKQLLMHAAAVHVSFEAEIEDVLTVAPIKKFIVAPMGVQPQAAAWSSGGDYIAWFGRYDIFAKGIDILLKAWTLIPKRVRPRLRLRGRDSLNTLQEVRNLIAELDLADSVSAGEPISGEEKIEFLLASMGCVFPSRGESHSVALVEALGLGVPCLITTTMPIHAELLSAEAGIVVEPTSDSVMRGIEALIGSSPMLGENAKRFVREELSWEVSLAKYMHQLQVLIPHSEAASTLE